MIVGMKKSMRKSHGAAEPKRKKGNKKGDPMMSACQKSIVNLLAKLPLDFGKLWINADCLCFILVADGASFLLEAEYVTNAIRWKGKASWESRIFGARNERHYHAIEFALDPITPDMQTHQIPALALGYFLTDAHDDDIEVIECSMNTRSSNNVMSSPAAAAAALNNEINSAHHVMPLTGLLEPCPHGWSGKKYQQLICYSMQDYHSQLKNRGMELEAPSSGFIPLASTFAK